MTQQHQETLSARQRVIIDKIDTAFARETDETDNHRRTQDKMRQIVIESFAEETLADETVETGETEESKEKSRPEAMAWDSPLFFPCKQYKRPRSATMSRDVAPLPTITEMGAAYLSGLHKKGPAPAFHGPNPCYTHSAYMRGRADRKADTSSPIPSVGVGTHCVVTPAVNMRRSC